MSGFKAYMLAHNIRQKEVADLLGISITSVNQKLNGRQDFSLAQVRVLCETYGVSADIFLKSMLQVLNNGGINEVDSTGLHEQSPD